MNVWGNPVLLGGGGAPVLTREEWEALTTPRKQAYGLVAIQETGTGYRRGSLVYGGDYTEFSVLQTGTGGTGASVEIQNTRRCRLLVIALNSEASTYALNISAALNGSPLTGETAAYHAYQGSGSNRRNYRIMRFELEAAAGDTLTIALSSCSNYTGLVYALYSAAEAGEIQKELSTADAACSGSSSLDGVAVYGTFVSSSGGTINLTPYTADTQISTAYPGSSYASGYIFWFA